MRFGEIIEKSFQYPWKNRSLWFYGILIALFSGGSSVSNNVKSEEVSSLTAQYPILGAPEFWIGAAVVGIILGILAIVISFWSQAAIMQGVSLLEKNKQITRKEIGKTGKRKVWNLIKLNVLIPIGIFLALLVVIAPIVYLVTLLPEQTALTVGIGLLVLFIFALIPLLFYFGVIWAVATRSVVLDDLKAIPSLKEARQIIKGHFWETFFFALILGVIVGMAGLFLVLPLIALIAVAVGGAIAKMYALMGIGVVISLAYLVFYLLAVGYLQAFAQTGWTLWWLELKKQMIKE